MQLECSIIYKSMTSQYAAMAQVVEHILGKDEVTSSNLVSSSRGSSAKAEELLFFLKRNKNCYNKKSPAPQ